MRLSSPGWSPRGTANLETGLMVLRPTLSLLSPAGARARLSIMIFHRVLPQRDPLFPAEVDADDFDRICGWVASMFNVLPLDEAVDRRDRSSLPARALSITFDDGYADNHDVAMPILQRHGLSAAFFVATGFLDGGRMWNDSVIEAIRRTQRQSLDLSHLGVDGLAEFDIGSTEQRRAAITAIIGKVKHRNPAERLQLVQAVAEACAASLPTDLMMRSDQVRAMRQGGMLVGAHTVSHPILAGLSASDTRREIADSRDCLQAILGEPVSLFAYPNGKPVDDYSDETVGIVRDLGFKAAVSTAWGAARADTDRHQLPRFTPWDQGRTRFGLRMMHNLWTT